MYISLKKTFGPEYGIRARPTPGCAPPGTFDARACALAYMHVAYCAHEIRADAMVLVLLCFADLFSTHSPNASIINVLSTREIKVRYTRTINLLSIECNKLFFLSDLMGKTTLYHVINSWPIL